MSGSSPQEIHILFLGATGTPTCSFRTSSISPSPISAGYIGGAVLNRLLSNGNAATFHITVLIRDSVKAHKLEPFGVKAVLGSLQDTDKLVALASETDLVFNCVS